MFSFFLLNHSNLAMPFLSLCNDTKKSNSPKIFLNVVKLLKKRKEKLSDRQSEANDKYKVNNNVVGKAERRPSEARSQETSHPAAVLTLGRQHVCLWTKLVTGCESGKNVKRKGKHEPRWLSVEPDCSSGPSIDEEMLMAPKDLKAHRGENWAGQCGEIRDKNAKKGKVDGTHHP